MKYGTLKGVNKKVSRYLLGTMYVQDTKEERARFDCAWENGINAIETAVGYGARPGSAELFIRTWMDANKIDREDVVILTKCSHPSTFRNRAHSFDISSDLFDSLAKLRTDYVDVLFMHRDDPDIPVKEIMDTLDWHYREGRIHAIGVSNWTLERVQEANRYAMENGLEGDGTISGPKYADERRWYVENNISVASYSSLSGGFFSGRIDRKSFEEDPDSYMFSTFNAYCDDVNFDRLERAQILADEKHVTLPQIALAYTLCSDMNVFPIIGAANPEEVKSSVGALDLCLTREECDWLDLTSDER